MNSATTTKTLAIVATAILAMLTALVIAQAVPRTASATDCTPETPQFCDGGQYGEPTVPEETTPENTTPGGPDTTVPTTNPTPGTTVVEPTEPTSGTTVVTEPTEPEPTNGGETPPGTTVVTNPEPTTDEPNEPPATDKPDVPVDTPNTDTPNTDTPDQPNDKPNATPDNPSNTPNVPDTPANTPDAPVVSQNPPPVVIQSPGPPAIIVCEVPNSGTVDGPVSVVVPDLDGDEDVQRGEINATAAALISLSKGSDITSATETASQYVSSPEAAEKAVSVASEAAIDNGIELDVLPDTSGPSLLLPLAALLIGGGILTTTILRRR